MGAVQDGGEGMIETLKNIAPMVCRYIMAAWLGWYVLSELMQHGEVEERTHDAGAAFFGCFFMVMLLAGGGFWG